MSSWWRIYAEQNGITITAGSSWAKICAAHFNATDNASSHPKRLALLVQDAGSPGLGDAGSWSRRLAEDDSDTLEPSGARALAINGGRAPLT